MKIIFHAHTNRSNDCNLTLEQITDKCKKSGVEAAILTDHNKLSFSGKRNGVKFFPGEEIKTKQGEIIGLFLEQEISQGLSVGETINKIKKQNGLVAVPHPFDRFRKSVLDKEALQKNLDRIDIIETYNARNLIRKDNQRAKEFYEKNKEKYNLAEIVGSDAHILSEFGNTLINIDDFSDADTFLNNLKEAEMNRKKISFFQRIIPHFFTKYEKMKNG